MSCVRILTLLIALIALSCSAALAQSGTGLTGKYYDAANFTSLVTTRTDATIDFDFGTSIPAGTALTEPTSYSVAWSGQIQPAYSELYTFHLTADDWARLWVNDELIVCRTFYQIPIEMRGQMRLKAGHRVNVRVEFFQNTGSARAKLEWASASQPRQVIPTNRLYPTTEVPNGGSVMREVWHGLPGASIATLTSAANYPNKPASREFISAFECLARDWEDGFGTRVTGFIRAPLSGNYTFAVSGDEVVQLYLSTDATPANKALIASATAPTGFRQWDAQPSQQSAPRALVAGQRYYVELLHKEDAGADHWSVAWLKPGDAAFSVIPGSVLMMPGTDLATPGTSTYFNTLATEQPRLGSTRERFTWLKQQYLSPTASAAKTRAQAVVSQANSDVANNTRHYGNEIPRLATAWWLTGDPVYAEKVWTHMQDLMANGDYTNKWKGFTLRQLAFGYDWLHPYWDATRRTTLVNFLINSGLNYQSNAYGNNIGILNDSGFMLASIAVGMANEGKGESNLSKAVGQLVQKIDQWEPNNGAWLEGTDYGIFAKLGLADAMQSIETALGSSFGIGRLPGFSTARREPLTIASNTRQRFTFSDVGTGSNNAMGWANWWARRYDALEVFDFSRLVGNSTWNSLLLPETTTSPAQAFVNPDTGFHGPADSVDKSYQHVATLRENWTDTKATFVGGMGGTYMSHGMLQSGTFQLSARGVNWFVDLKSEAYDVPNHNGTTPVSGADRWDYYRNRAEGHNCLIVNPTSQPDRIWNAPPAPMIAFQSAQGGQRSFAVWDLSGNITGVTRVQRGIQLLGNRRQILVQDEIVTPSASNVWWFAHFNSSRTATIGADPTTVTLESGTERLWGKIVSGGGVWTVRTATPLPSSPAPAENADNSAYRKLAINLTGVSSTTLAVWFVPLAPGENPPTAMPAVTPLNTWNLVAQNEAPVAQSSGANSVGGAPVDVDLRALVRDEWTPAAQMTFAAGGAIGGSVMMQPDGFTARFTPAPGFTGAQSFTYFATDPDGAASNVATIVIGASPVVANWTGTTSGSWSTAANWQGNIAPVSGRGADIQFFNGQTLAATTITATNTLPGTTEANRLNFSGTGTATTVVNVNGNPLRLVRNGTTSATISLTGVTVGFRYNIANDIALDDSVTFNASNSGTFVFNGALSGTGGVTRVGSFSTLILAGNNSYAGPTTISAGTLQIGNDGATGTLGDGPVSIASGASLRLDRAGLVEVANDLAGAGALVISGPTMNDVVRLTGDNTFTGAVTVGSGSLRITDAAQLGDGAKTISATSGTAALRLDGTGGAVELPAAFSLFTSNPNGAIINEAGDNRIGGSVTLAAGAGGTRITSLAGTLSIEGNVSPNTTGRTLDLRGAGNGIIAGNVLDGSTTNTLGTVSKNDAGTWTLNGNNSFTGGTTVSGGRLVINGSHASGPVSVAAVATLAGRGSLSAAATVSGTLAPGDPIGTLTLSDTVSFGSGSKVQWELASNSSAGDQVTSASGINVTAGARIDVVLNRPGSAVNFLHAFWRSARTFPIVTGASLSGAFTLGTVTADAGGRPVATYGSFTLQHTTTAANLVWTPLPGFPVIDDPAIAITRPATQPVSIADEDHALRVSAAATGGVIGSYAWTFVSGPGLATFENASAADTRVTFTEAGAYVLRCTATNEVGSAARELTVEVAPAPETVVVQEGVNGASCPATLIRTDVTTMNSGARDQLLVGRVPATLRTLLSFPMPAVLDGAVIADASLDLTLCAVGIGTTLGQVNVHRLLVPFTEGTGDGVNATSGSGTGADWLRRTYTPSTAWAVSGGSAGTDYEAAPLSSVPGFDAANTDEGTAITFDTSAAFAAAIASAASSAQPLGLLVKAAVDTSGDNNAARFASDDHATTEWHPQLTIGYHDHLAPIIDPDSAPAASVGVAVTITGTVANGAGLGWTYASGPGPVFFVNATTTSATLLFTKPGTHLLRLSASNAHGETSRTLAIEVTGTAWSELQIWRQTYFGSTGNNDLIDTNGDGEVNLLEFATGQNPLAATRAATALVRSGATLEFTFTRSRAAMADGVTFTVEWSDTLLPNSWSHSGVTEELVSDNGAVQTVRASVPAGSGRRFAHLKVAKP